jgi:type I restriction-modification system DNA methylase subunit
VLTQCLVKYALKELLDPKRPSKRADDILTLTVCEPAMGSAAFLNEAVNQLAEAYLERKQELGRRIPTTATRRSCRRCACTSPTATCSAWT